MKILYSCLSKSWGGMEMFTLSAAEKLRDRGILVEILCIRGSKLDLVSQQKGFVTHRVSDGFSILDRVRLAKTIREENYDIIHSQASADLWTLVPLLLLLRIRTPLIMTKQVGSYVRKKDFLHNILYKRLDFALAISRVIEKNLLDTCNLTEEKVLLLHNFVDTKRFNPETVDHRKLRRELGIGPDKLLIGMLARFSPGKGHEDFLRAAKSVSEKFPSARFLITGEPSRGEDQYAAQIRQMVSDLGIEKLVIFTGFREDIPEVLGALDVFAFPSHSEAFGIALAEALSMAVPSVCCASDGVLDIAVDNETSLLFEKMNFRDMAEKIEILLEDSGLRARLGAASRKRALENFDSEVITDEVLKIYDRAITKSRK